MDLKLTADNDMDLTNGSLSFVQGKEAHAQALKMLFQTWLGETIYDVKAGVPYIQTLFKGKNPDLNSLTIILQRLAVTRSGVISARFQLGLADRILSVQGTVVTIDGEIDFTQDLDIP